MAGKQKLKDIQQSAEREQELLDEIESLQGETARQATEIRAFKARDTERQRREHRAQQEKRQAAERKERRDRINDLAAGKLDLKGATQWAIVHEEGARPGIEVFVPLDDEEQTVALGYLRRNPSPAQYEVARPRPTSEMWDEIRNRFHAVPVHIPFVGPFASHPVII